MGRRLRIQPLSWPRRAALVLTASGLCALAGCALIASKPVPPPQPVAQAAPPPPPKPQLAAPVDTHRFVLSGPDDEVVGTVQVTVASQADTLSDIARRFNVGFDEEAFDAAPGAFPLKLVGMVHLVTSAHATLAALDDQPWHLVPVVGGGADLPGGQI